MEPPAHTSFWGSPFLREGTSRSHPERPASAPLRPGCPSWCINRTQPLVEKCGRWLLDRGGLGLRRLSPRISATTAVLKRVQHPHRSPDHRGPPKTTQVRESGLVGTGPRRCGVYVTGLVWRTSSNPQRGRAILQSNGRRPPQRGGICSPQTGC